jgi:hypothetical protein
MKSAFPVSTISLSARQVTLVIPPSLTTLTTRPVLPV